VKILKNGTITYKSQYQVTLATLPSFSNEVKEDQYTVAQTLQKVLLHRQASAWKDK
jgi:hypothetical protein